MAIQKKNQNQNKRSSPKEQLLTSNHFLMNFPPWSSSTYFSYTERFYIFWACCKINFIVKFLFLTECFLFFKEDIFSVQKWLIYIFILYDSNVSEVDA